MTAKYRSPRFPRAIILAALGAVPSLGFATDYTWNAPAGGSFATTTNWTPASPAGGPAAADRAVFNLNNTYGVTFSASAINTAFRETQGNVAFDIGSGRSYTVSGGNSFELGNTAGQTANLSITSGTLAFSQDNSTIGLVSGSTGNLTINGAGTFFTTGGHYCDIGVGGTGSITIQNGAAASIGGGSPSFIGANSGSNGRLQIWNTGTTASISGLTIGASGTGVAEVDFGATASFGSGLIIGAGFGSSGLLKVGGSSGSSTANTFGFTAGYTNGATGNVTISAGGTLNNAGNVNIARESGAIATAALQAGGTWNQSGGSIYIGGNSASAGGSGALNVAGNLNITGASNGITIRGSGSAPNNGTLNLSNGTLSTPSLTRDPNGIFNFTGGTLQINGGPLTLNQSSYALDGPRSGPTLNFNGFNSTFGPSSISLSVGTADHGTFNVMGGAQPIVLSLQAGSGGGTASVNVSGTGTRLFSFTTTILGSGGTGTMNLSTGGQFLGNGNVYVGQLGGVANLSVSDPGSSIQAGTGGFHVGYNGGQGSVSIQNSATATAPQMTIGEGDASVGDVVVNGAGSSFAIDGIAVGYGTGARGTLLLDHGATATGSLLAIAVVPNAVGQVTVTAPGTSISYSSQIVLGSPSATGTVATVTFSGGATATTSELQLNNNSTVNLNAATLNLASFTNNGGTFNFNSGSVNFTSAWNADFAQVTGLLGAGGALGPGRTIGVGGAMTLQSALTLNGGTLRAASVTGASSLVLNSGIFELTNSSLTIGSAGLLGANVTVGTGLTLRLSGAASTLDVANGGTLYIPGGNVSAINTTISGRAQLASPVAQMNSPVTINAGGVLQGTGQIHGNLAVNSGGTVRVLSSDYLLIDGTSNTMLGIVDLQGGTAEWRGQVTVGVAGVISGRGSINTNSANPAAATGLTNNGTLQLSAGFTDIFGPVASTSGSRIIVTGGSTTTFYRNVTLAAGSNFQVSANSNAVFFGNVAGTGNFTGSGTKYFEAGSSVLGEVQTLGSTSVEAPASVTANYFQENSLTVNGHATIATSGGTSHLNALNIAGSPDNWSGTLDLKNNSLVLEAGDLATITNQIKNGLLHGTGIISSAPASPFRLGSISNSNGSGGARYSSFRGITGLDGNEVLVRYTLIGDVNLDGTVSIADFIDLASHFNQSGPSINWQAGDVNYDGTVSIADFIDLASNFNQSMSGEAIPLTPQDSLMLSSFAASIGANAVPEPASLVLSALAACAIKPRRRRR